MPRVINTRMCFTKQKKTTSTKMLPIQQGEYTAKKQDFDSFK